MLMTDPHFVQGQIDSLYEVVAALAELLEERGELLLRARPRLLLMKQLLATSGLPPDALTARNQAIDAALTWLQNVASEDPR